MQSVMIVVAAGRVHLNVSREKKYPCLACCTAGMYTNLDRFIIFRTNYDICFSETELNFNSSESVARLHLEGRKRVLPFISIVDVK